MIVAKTIDQIRNIVSQWKSDGLKVGFVPTMGFFHEGHLSLMKESLKRSDRTVVSIFVNPTQFGPKEDFSTYPRDLDRDLNLAKEVGVHGVFIPDVKEMYPSQNKTWVNVEDLTNHLCGASRPGHFKGVATVVAKLFNIVQPDLAIFGEKDFQQLQVIRRMTADLNFPIEIVGAPIFREPDGLAMSSRNTYLSREERKSAICLFKALQLAKRLVAENKVTTASQLQRALADFIESFPFTQIDYIFVGDPELLEPVNEIRLPLLVALAVFVGKTRLIDNILIR
ncbi:MAG: pantoate--beta-alanine ligase [Thermodesulfobacteria bacterium]|nr:pantoate--beta-alanine ligase [Thermodesulfobacteriota bacterium]